MLWIAGTTINHMLMKIKILNFSQVKFYFKYYTKQVCWRNVYQFYFETYYLHSVLYYYKVIYYTT